MKKTPTIRDTFETVLQETVWSLFEDHICPHCAGVFVDKGARCCGIQVTPDELTCPAEFEPDEPSCVNAHLWTEAQHLIEQLADVLEEARYA